MLGFQPLNDWWALTGSNRRPSRCKRDIADISGSISSFIGGTDRDLTENIAAFAGHFAGHFLTVKGTQ